MGTRTYSRRAADGTRVLTALGRARAGNIAQELDIFGNEIPDSPQPVPTPAPVSTKATLSDAEMQKVVDLMAPVERFDRRRKPVVFSPADIQQVINDVGVDRIKKAFDMLDQANADIKKYTREIDYQQRNRQPAKTWAGGRLNVGGWYQDKMRNLLRNMINNPDDPQTKQDYDNLKNIMVNGQIKFNSTMFGSNDGVVTYLFNPMPATEFDSFMQRQVTNRKNLNDAMARNARTRNILVIASPTDTAGSLRVAAFNNRLSQQLNEAVEKAQQLRFDYNTAKLLSTWLLNERIIAGAQNYY